MLARICAALAWTLLLIPGCGSGESRAETTATASPDPILTAAPTAAATPEVSAPNPPAAPADLLSFRYRLVARANSSVPASPDASAPSGRVTVTSSGLVAGDRHRSITEVDIGFGAIVSERIVIGARTWTRDGQNPWVEERAGASATPLTLGIDPTRLAGADATARLRSLVSSMPPTGESIDGLDTLRYELAAGQLQTLFAPGAGQSAVPPGPSTLWVTRAQLLPVRLQLEGTTGQGTAVEVALEVTDHNAGGITIEPP